MNMVSRLNSRRHCVFKGGQTEVGRWLGREFPRNGELFVYFHYLEGTWVIAAWENRQHSLFHDVLNLGASGYRNLSRERLQERLHPVMNGREMRRALEADEYKDLRRMTDESMTDAESRHPRKIQILTS